MSQQQRHEVIPTPKAKSALDIIRKCNAHGLVGYAYGGDEGDLPFVREAEKLGWITWAYDIPADALNRLPHRSVFSITLAGRAALADEPKCSTCHKPLDENGQCPDS